VRRGLLAEQVQEKGLEFGVFVGRPDDSHVACGIDEAEELHSDNGFLDSFMRIDARGASEVFRGKPKEDSSRPDHNINGGAEVPVDMDGAAVVHKTR